MPVEYPVTPLGEIAHIEMGQSPDSATVRDREGIGVPFLQGNAEFGSLYPFPRFTCLAPMKMCKAGDILISVRAPVGAINIADRDYCIGRGLAAIRIEGMASLLAAHLISAAAPALRRVAQGTTFEAINKADLASLMVKAPTSTDRAPLSQFLDTLDTTIRQTEAVIEKLKLVKQGLLHDLLTRGIDANGELRPPQSEAPHLYKASPLGWIPACWQETTIGSSVTLSSGGTPSKALKSNWDGSFPLLTPKDMKSFELADTSEHISEKAAVTGSKVMPPETIFVVVRGMILAHSFPVVYVQRAMAFTQDIKAISVGPGLQSRFLAHWFVANANYFLGKVTESTHGTKKLDSEELLSAEICIPPEEEQVAIVARYSALDSRVATEEAYANQLQSLKSGLMDDLLTGRVRVTPLLQGQAT